jgi:hypothetical protein
MKTLMTIHENVKIGHIMNERTFYYKNKEMFGPGLKGRRRAANAILGKDRNTTGVSHVLRRCWWSLDIAPGPTQHQCGNKRTHGWMFTIQSRCTS